MSETTQFAGMDGNMSSNASLKANAVLMSRYQVTGVLGGGGMGTVYQARDLHFPDAHRFVAIKEMQTLTNDPTVRTSMLKTFQREANILATLNHSAIPKIFDFFDVNDRAYLIMEFINGSDLELLLQKTKDLPIDKIIEWAVDLADVLNYLHKHEPDPIVFRDMKPSNVMVDSQGKVRLIDFGIAKTFVKGVKNTMIGTEGYSAPEQYKGDVNPLSDIYSLGATLHHVLTRRDPRLEPPFSFNERPILELNPKVPPELASIVERAVSFDAKTRFQSCIEMKEALDKLRYRSLNVGASMPRPASGGSGTPASADAAVSTSFFEDDENTGTIQAKWTFKTEDEIRSSPTTMNDLAYVGSYDTNIWAVKADTGEFVWKFPTNGGIASSPIPDAGNRTLLFGSEDGTFYSVDSQKGRLSWKYATKDRIRGTARLAHDHVFFGSDDGRLYALNAANGRFLWAYDTGGPVRSRPWITDDQIIVGSDTGEIIGVTLSGQRKWSFRTKRAIISSPVVDKDNMCYIGSQDNFLYALDAGGGMVSWRFRTNGPIISSPSLANNLVIIASADGSVYAVNSQSGKEKWKFAINKPVVASPVVKGNSVYVGSTDAYLYCLDVDTGRERWKFHTGGPITSACALHTDAILLGCMDKTLYALPLVG